MSTSEVANLRQQIEQELVAMRLGLSGLSTGTTKHQFIEARMHNLGAYEEQLAVHVGEEQATHISCQAYIRVMEANG